MDIKSNIKQKLQVLKENIYPIITQESFETNLYFAKVRYPKVNESPMTYEQAKARKAELESLVSSIGNELNKFPKNSTGMFSDEVRAKPEWKLLKQKSTQAFKDLQNFNTYFVKTFKKEYKAERDNRLSQFMKP